MPAHRRLRVVARVVHALRLAAQHGSHTRLREVVGVHVVGVDVVLCREQRRAAAQAFARVAARPVQAIDAGRAQDTHASGMQAAMPAHPPFGVDTPLGARCRRCHAARFVEARTGCIAVHAAGADIDQALQARAARQRCQQVGGAPIGRAVCGRRCQVQHRVGQAGQPRQRCNIVQVTEQRHSTCAAQQPQALGRRSQGQHAPAPGQQAQHAQPNVTAADDQQGGTAQSQGRQHVWRRAFGSPASRARGCGHNPSQCRSFAVPP